MAHSLMVTKSAGGCGAARLGGPYEALRCRTDQGGGHHRSPQSCVLKFLISPEICSVSAPGEGLDAKI